MPKLEIRMFINTTSPNWRRRPANYKCRHQCPPLWFGLRCQCSRQNSCLRYEFKCSRIVEVKWKYKSRLTCKYGLVPCTSMFGQPPAIVPSCDPSLLACQFPPFFYCVKRAQPINPPLPELVMAHCLPSEGVCTAEEKPLAYYFHPSWIS